MPHGEPEEEHPSPRAGGRRRRRRWALVVGLAVLTWAVLAASSLVGARASAEAGRAALNELRGGVSPSTLLSGDAASRLRSAQADFEEARAGVRSPWVSPLRALPVVGRQLRSMDALSAAAAEVASTGAAAVEEAGQHLATGLPAGPERARMVADLAAVASEAERRLAGIDLGPDQALVGPLAEARRTAVEELEELRGTLHRARVATTGLAELLNDDSTYLLLLGNNAEMRAGSGMFLTVGTLVISDGSLSVGEIVPTFDFQLAEGVPLDGDLADRWGWLEPGREWRNLGVSPRFDVTAPLASRMWSAARGQEVDGVLAIDVLGLQALLAAVGPIEVDGQQVGSDNVADDLLHDQYVGLDLDDPTAQAERRGRLADVARSTLEALEGADVDAARLAEELAGAARARHLMAWSTEAPVQQAWEAMDIDGALDADDLLVAVVNRGGNKLDPYLEVDADLSVQSGPEVTAVSVELRLRNAVSPDEPEYILGPSPPLEVAPGTYVGLVAVSLPGAAAAGRFDGVEQLPVAGADGPTRVVAAPIEIPAGQQQVLTLRFELPPGPGAMDVLPSARTPAVSWRWQDRAWKDDHTEVVAW